MINCQIIRSCTYQKLLSLFVDAPKSQGFGAFIEWPFVGGDAFRAIIWFLYRFSLEKDRHVFVNGTILLVFHISCIATLVKVGTNCCLLPPIPSGLVQIDLFGSSLNWVGKLTQTQIIPYNSPGSKWVPKKCKFLLKLQGHNLIL